MSDSHISIKMLADELGMDRSHARKYVLKTGIRPKRARTPDSGNQLALALTAQEAEYIRAKRQEEGYRGGLKEVESPGFFYVIRLVPDLDARRVKFGFANDPDDRLSQHQTAAPTAVLVKTWPCRRGWEITVMDALASECRLIASEVYECDDMAGLVARGDALFGLLPKPASRPALAACSPLNT